MFTPTLFAPWNMSTGDHSNLSLEAVFLKDREGLLAFLRSRGAEGIAEDVLHDVWLRLPRGDDGTIRFPRAYIYRMVNFQLVDRVRKQRNENRRDGQWLEHNDLTAEASALPGPDRVIEARQEIERILAAIGTQSERARRILWRHRVDGLTQREVAAELGISLGTVESDLRQIYRLLFEARRKINAGDG